MTTIFFCYSHRDSAMRDELQAHLSTMKRQGEIELFHDRCIRAGDEWEGEISKNLDEAEIILLLISPYFLASNYCSDVELVRAMERHDAGEARVIPVILEWCDWRSAPFGKLLAVPSDGTPISKYPNPHEAFVEIVDAIRNVLKERHPSERPRTFSTRHRRGNAREAGDRSSNLRIKKTFSDHDRDAFLDDAFDYIAKFFERSLDELQKRNPDITSRFRPIDGTCFTAAVYRNGESVTSCRVRLQEDFGRMITYAYSHGAAYDSGYNESLSVESDSHKLYLKPAGLAYCGEDKDEQLTHQGAAEFFWSLLMRGLQE